ncbi:alkaline foam protein A [Phyllosticta citricarpa]|uniref:Alkaline foam protein A n=2 Tax=Phyllosticta TaxID=121621 RepID=A0ABR1M9H9_9PEZI
MQFKNFVAAAALAGSASALPAAQQEVKIVDTSVGVVETSANLNVAVDVPASNLKTFGLIAIMSGSPLQNQALAALQSGLSIGRKQDANCFDKTSDFATFQLNVDTQELFLFNTTEVSKQQFYTDRSGMGRGVLQYSDGVNTYFGKRSESKGFTINENGALKFDGSDFLACPYGDSESEWTVSIDVGITDPFNTGKNCTGFLAKTIETTDPVGCIYSNYQV